MPIEPEESKGEHSEPEKEEDMGITFVARKAPETPKERPKSGEQLRDNGCTNTIKYHFWHWYTCVLVHCIDDWMLI